MEQDLEEEDELDEFPVDLPIRETVRRYLTEQSVSYVDVAVVKKSLFSHARLRTFDFVVHAPAQPSWLLLASDASQAAQEDLREWEKVFGPGFMGVMATQIEDGPLAFRTLAGEKISLE